jgi:hypothetical protein
MNYLRIKESKLESITVNNRFVISLQLSRYLNLINSNHRQFLRIEKNNNPVNRRDQIEVIFYHSAILFETLKGFFSLTKLLKELPSWKQNLTIIMDIQKAYNNKNSFINLCLKKIRNELLFHYDLNTIENTLKNCKISKDTYFAEAISGKRLDYAFTLVDDCQIIYALENYKKKGSIIEKWNQFQDELFDLSSNTVTIIFDLLIDSIKYFVEMVDEE